MAKSAWEKLQGEYDNFSGEELELTNLTHVFSLKKNCSDEISNEHFLISIHDSNQDEQDPAVDLIFIRDKGGIFRIEENTNKTEFGTLFFGKSADDFLIELINSYRELDRDVENIVNGGNAHESWIRVDDEQLLIYHSEGKSIEEMMQIFKRTRGGIQCRLKYLANKK